MSELRVVPNIWYQYVKYNYSVTFSWFSGRIICKRLWVWVSFKPASLRFLCERVTTAFNLKFVYFPSTSFSGCVILGKLIHIYIDLSFFDLIYRYERHEREVVKMIIRFKGSRAWLYVFMKTYSSTSRLPRRDRFQH